MTEEIRELKEQLLVLKQARAERLSGDPLFRWNALPKQRAFIEAVFMGKFNESWFVAANRAGKSDAGAYIGSCLARFGRDPMPTYAAQGQIELKDRATSGWVVSLDSNESRDVIEPKYFDNGFLTGAESHQPFIPKREISEWRVSDRILKLKCGSIIGFKSCESGTIKFPGVSKDWVHFDEAPPENIHDECAIRVEAGKKLTVFGTCTLLPPEGKIGGISWIMSKYIQPWQSGKRKDIGIFGASIYDNPYIDRSQIERLESIYGIDTVLGRIRLGGEYLPGLSGARAYHSFDRRTHVREQPPIMQRRPLMWAWDFNVEPMISIVAQKEGDLFRIFRTLHIEEASVLDMVQLFVEAFPHHQGEIWIYGDATGKNRSAQTGRSDYQLILNAMRTYGAPVKLKVPEANPFVPDRISALNRQLRDETGQSHIEIDPIGNDELVSDLEEVLRDGRGGIKKTFDRSDPYCRRTHSSDALGYLICYEAPVRPLARELRPAVKIDLPGYAWTQVN